MKEESFKYYKTEHMRRQRCTFSVELNGKKMLKINANELLKINDILEDVLKINAENLLKFNGHLLKINIELLKINIENGENELKTAFLGGDSAQKGGGGLDLFINNNVTPNNVVTRDSHIKEKINKKESENVRADFEAFWTAWPKHPRKLDKKKTFERYSKALKTYSDLTPGILFEALDWYKTSDQWERDNGRYIPAPEVWLNKPSWKVLEQIETATIKALMPVKAIPAEIKAQPQPERRAYTPQELGALLSKSLNKNTSEAAK